MPSQKRQFGDTGEEAAANYLKQKGYKILDRNWRIKGGEIDIVAAKTSGIIRAKIEEIIFVEVKTIKGAGSEFDAALAAQNVHYQKQRRLIRAARTYLAHKKIPPQTPWRIDVLLVALDSSTSLAKIEHLENAVWGK